MGRDVFIEKVNNLKLHYFILLMMMVTCSTVLLRFSYISYVCVCSSFSCVKEQRKGKGKSEATVVCCKYIYIVN